MNIAQFHDLRLGIIFQEPVDKWPVCDCLISFHSKGFPLEKALAYAELVRPFTINNLRKQFDLQVREFSK